MKYQIILNQKQRDISVLALEEYGDKRNHKWENYVRDIVDNCENNYLKNIGHCIMPDVGEAYEKALVLFNEAFNVAHPDDVPTPLQEDAKRILEYVKTIKADKDGLYPLRFSEDDITTFKAVLEEFFRTRMGQWFDFVNDVALNGFSYNREDPENSKKFNAYIDRRDEAQKLLDKAYRVAEWRLSMKSDKQLVAEDIWDVIKHQLWEDLPDETKKAIPLHVDSHSPLNVSTEPLPLISKIEE